MSEEQEIKVDVSSAEETLQSAMNKLILDWGSAEEIPASYLLEIAQIQALLQIAHESIRPQPGLGLPMVYGRTV